MTIRFEALRCIACSRCAPVKEAEREYRLLMRIVRAAEAWRDMKDGGVDDLVAAVDAARAAQKKGKK